MKAIIRFKSIIMHLMLVFTKAFTILILPLNPFAACFQLSAARLPEYIKIDYVLFRSEMNVEMSSIQNYKNSEYFEMNRQWKKKNQTSNVNVICEHKANAHKIISQNWMSFNSLVIRNRNKCVVCMDPNSKNVITIIISVEVSKFSIITETLHGC